MGTLRWRSVVAGCCVAVVAAVAARQVCANEPAKQAFAGTFAREAVAADHPVASAAGEEILAKGGNAVDAAVATSFTLSVVRPFSCGIGGGGFMVIALPAGDGRAGQGAVRTAINYRETCPAGVGPEYFETLDEQAPRRGGKAVATPGTIAGLLYALDTYGTMKRSDVLAPAIRVAKEGFVVDGAYARAAREMVEQFKRHPEWKERFAVVWERYLKSGAVKEGDRIVIAEQAKAFEAIARDGVEAVTKGELGAAMCAAAGRAGGTLAAADLAAFKVVEVPPLKIESVLLGKRTLLTMPPPSSGGVAMGEALGIMERLELRKKAEKGEWPQYTHCVVESFKHAFADRAEWMGDPAFGEVPVARLLGDEYLSARARTVRPLNVLAPEEYGTREHEPLQGPEDGGTSHLCVVDARGGAVACTETINLLFGSLVAVPEYGFILNDQMDDFTTRRGQKNAFGLVQSERNLPAPGKRPLSSMTPTIVVKEDGSVDAVVGASGGPRIITGTTQVLLNTYVLGLPAGEAVARPRVHHQWWPNQLEMEDNYPGAWNGLEVRFWMSKFHQQVKPEMTEHACVQFIRRTEKGWAAACDPRKGGAPAGK